MKFVKTRISSLATALIVAASGVSATAITAYAATSYPHNYKTVVDDDIKLKSVRTATYYKGTGDDYMIATNTVKPTNEKKYYAYSQVKWKYKNIYGKWKWDESDDATDYVENYTTKKKSIKSEALTTSWFERDSKWTSYFKPSFKFGKAK